MASLPSSFPTSILGQRYEGEMLKLVTPVACDYRIKQFSQGNSHPADKLMDMRERFAWVCGRRYAEDQGGTQILNRADEGSSVLLCVFEGLTIPM
jgi:hypothetical protein